MKAVLRMSLCLTSCCTFKTSYLDISGLYPMLTNLAIFYSKNKCHQYLLIPGRMSSFRLCIFIFCVMSGITSCSLIPSNFLKDLVISLKEWKVQKNERKKHIFHLSGRSTNGHNSLLWARPNSWSRNSILTSHLGNKNLSFASSPKDSMLPN